MLEPVAKQLVVVEQHRVASSAATSLRTESGGVGKSLAAGKKGSYELMLEQRSSKRKRWRARPEQLLCNKLETSGGARAGASLKNARQRRLILAIAAQQAMYSFPVYSSLSNLPTKSRFCHAVPLLYRSSAAHTRHILLRKRRCTDQCFNSNPLRRPSIAIPCQKLLLQDAALHMDIHASSALRVSTPSELADLLFSTRHQDDVNGRTA